MKATSRHHDAEVMSRRKSLPYLARPCSPSPVSQRRHWPRYGLSEHSQLDQRLCGVVEIYKRRKTLVAPWWKVYV